MIGEGIDEEPGRSSQVQTHRLLIRLVKKGTIKILVVPSGPKTLLRTIFLPRFWRTIWFAELIVISNCKVAPRVVSRRIAKEGGANVALGSRAEAVRLFL